jgi:hypothetical protein
MVTIIKHFDLMDTTDIYPSIVKGQYDSAPELYQDIVGILTELNRSCDLLDMMPFIDDYIETYFNL